jgi:hypothetical protein
MSVSIEVKSQLVLNLPRESVEGLRPPPRHHAPGAADHGHGGVHDKPARPAGEAQQVELLVTLDGISFDACKARGHINTQPDITFEPEHDGKPLRAQDREPEHCVAPKRREPDIQELLMRLLAQLFARAGAEPADNERSAPTTKPPRRHGPEPVEPQAPKATRGDDTLAAPGQLPGFDPHARPAARHGIDSGDSEFAAEKLDVNRALDKAGLRQADLLSRALVMAFAMMQGAGRDESKDGTASASGPLGLNESVLRMAGEKGSTTELARRASAMSMDEAVQLLLKAVSLQGLDQVKRAVCGGEATRQDPASNGFDKFTRNFDFTLQSILGDKKLLTDPRRVWTAAEEPQQAPAASGKPHIAGTDQPKAPVAAASKPAPAHAAAASSPGPEIDPQIQPTGAHGVQTGLTDYAQYKQRLNAAMDAAGIAVGDKERRAQIIAFSMMEGTVRDSSKDGTASANGPLNLNETILRMAGVEGSSQDLSRRMPTMSPEEAVKHLNTAIDKHGLELVKRAQRGGETTRNDPNTYKYAEFSQNYNFTLNAIRQDKALLQDDRRVWAETPWVGDTQDAKKPADQ